MSHNIQETDGDNEDFDDGPVDIAGLETGACNDPLPEYAQYLDEGCGLSNSCLNCPFPKCVYDVPGGMQRYETDKRAREIIFQHGRGLTAKQIGQMLQENTRTIQRVIREFKNATSVETENERETWDE